MREEVLRILTAYCLLCGCLLGCSEGPTEPRVSLQGSIGPLENSELWVSGHKLLGPTVSYKLIGTQLCLDGEIVEYDDPTTPSLDFERANVLVEDLLFWLDWTLTNKDLYPDGALILLTKHGNYVTMSGEFRMEAQGQIDCVLSCCPLDDIPPGPLDPAAPPLLEIINVRSCEGGDNCLYDLATAGFHEARRIVKVK